MRYKRGSITRTIQMQTHEGLNDLQKISKLKQLLISYGRQFERNPEDEEIQKKIHELRGLIRQITKK